MQDTVVLRVNPAAEKQLSEELRACGDVDPITALKSSMDGSVPEAVVTIFAARQAILLIRDVILHHIKNKNIKSIKIGDFEAQNVSLSDFETLYQTYLQAVAKHKDKSDTKVEHKGETPEEESAS